MGTDRAFAADLIALRPQPGQASSAANMHRLLDGSAIVASHRDDDPRVQDAYSLRCAPQVHGAARDALDDARRVADAELASAIDNPMVLPDGRVESCGNFHGAPSASPATSWRSPRPRSAPSPSAGPTGCSTRRARTGCRRSSRRTPGSTPG